MGDGPDEQPEDVQAHDAKERQFDSETEPGVDPVLVSDLQVPLLADEVHPDESHQGDEGSA
jgi:hypothetical protein